MYFSLGSNLGERMAHLKKAALLLEEALGSCHSHSSFYESEAWGYQSEKPYVNCCVAISSGVTPLEAMGLALGIEQQMGRKRSGSGYGDRIIDIDLLLAGSRVLREPSLILPHPRMHLRRFVLEPLAEIAPDLVHPKMQRTITQLLDRCPDKAPLRILG